MKQKTRRKSSKRWLLTMMVVGGLLAVLFSLVACGDGEGKEPDVKADPVVYRIYSIRAATGVGNNEDSNDMARFITSLQGRLNKKSSETGIYLYQMFDDTDRFWLEYIMGEGKFLAGYPTVPIRKWSDLWEIFGEAIRKAGIVVWDPAVPATSNVAATICSVEGYLPVRYDTDADSLYAWLTQNGVAVKQNLCGLFTGEKEKIADTDISSSGSAKCDAYLWALEKYFDRCNSGMLAYVLDGASQVESNPVYQNAVANREANDPSHNQIYSHDYYIYNECFFFDLTCTRSEAPCDDPDQPMGADYRTLCKILATAEKRNNGKMGKLMGFPPWYMKYTTYHNNGKIESVDLEWNFTSLLSSYNLVKEADAAFPSWMTNASVYCQYPSTLEKYENNEPPAPQTFDPKVRYFTVYIGDYDSSAWLKYLVPKCFTSDARGEIPLMWAYNPNLSDRVPMIFDYVYENKTAMDYFVTGDSGAGYVMPTFLSDLDLWKEYNAPYLEKFDMDVVGFIIDKRFLTKREFKAYAEMGIKGAFYNTYRKPLVVYNNETVFVQMGDIYPDEGTEWLEQVYGSMRGKGNSFSAFRTICLRTDHIVDSIKRIEAYANAQKDGYTYKYVDMYTLFDLVLQSGQGEHISGK